MKKQHNHMRWLQCIASLALALLSVFPRNAAAQSVTTCAHIEDDCRSCHISGTSLNNMAGVTIYDDGVFNYYTDNTVGSSLPFFGWNCGNQFLFTEYVSNAYSISLSFSYEGEITSFPVLTHSVVVTNPDGSISGPFAETDIFPFNPASPSVVSLTCTFSPLLPPKRII